MGDFRHANFGIPHSRGGVAVDRAEVALPIYQWVAQGEILSHSHDSVVNR